MQELFDAVEELAARDCLSPRIDWARALTAIALREGIAIDVSRSF